MQAVILAGGKGTRLGNVEVPKVMIDVGGIPVLQHQIELLRLHGVKDIILCVKHISGKIKDYFGDGSKFGVRIRYSEEKDFFGTAGAVKNAEEMLAGTFVLLYGDVMLNMNIAKFLEFHRDRKAEVTLAVHGTDHPHDSDMVEMNGDGKVSRFWRPGKDETPPEMANSAVHVMERSVLRYVEAGKKIDFGKVVFPEIVAGGKVYGYETEEYIKDMGTPERLEKVRNDYERGSVFPPAAFLDRDGVINREISLLHKPSQLEIIEGSAEGIKLLNDSGIKVVVVTNQPVVARNMCTEKDIVKIHEKMSSMIGEKGARVDAYYFCPHHPHKGYPDENPDYKMECECRKPKPGMILQGCRDHGLNPRKSFMVGDRTSDMAAGKEAGCETILVRTGEGGKDGKVDMKPDHVAENLLEAAKLVIKNLRSN